MHGSKKTTAVITGVGLTCNWTVRVCVHVFNDASVMMLSTVSRVWTNIQTLSLSEPTHSLHLLPSEWNKRFIGTNRRISEHNLIQARYLHNSDSTSLQFTYKEPHNKKHTSLHVPRAVMHKSPGVPYSILYGDIKQAHAGFINILISFSVCGFIPALHWFQHGFPFRSVWDCCGFLRGDMCVQYKYDGHMTLSLLKYIQYIYTTLKRQY